MFGKSSPGDKLLKVIILILTGCSGATTVGGCIQIAPSYEIGLLFGIAVQSILFLLLANYIVKKKLFFRTCLIFLFAGISVYTSFFSIFWITHCTSEKRKIGRNFQPCCTILIESCVSRY
jgi:hypothetical protein